jgi:DNA-binding response OmpR family regulator
MDTTSPKKILIVEDEVPLLKALSDTFTKEKFNVLQARDGQSALTVAFAEKPDLILLDIVLPVMDGLSMLKKLREGGDYGKNVQVVLLTNLSADNEVIHTAITENNPTFYLVKTNWTIPEVVTKVKESLGMH